MSFTARVYACTDLVFAILTSLLTCLPIDRWKAQQKPPKYHVIGCRVMKSIDKYDSYGNGAHNWGPLQRYHLELTF